MAEPGVAIEPFVRAAAAGTADDELLVVPQWQAADWKALFSHARPVHVASGEVLIRRNVTGRSLYFLVSGQLEVTAILGGHSLGSIAKVRPGSVVGELAFLDGMPRSAKVWAVADSVLYQLEFEDYQRFADAHPRAACDLVFALGRIVALRLRHSQTRGAR